ncbi:MAG: TM0996/MTH895 family glutaredoxin-like protein [Armatimonadetes bacterium]|jgi:small redox-active disulfide protein 2|nr:TM0996/MTH895 family glutaredoxin-like protein [Armatimonadota bacterium]MDI9586556.1 thioredoxin family protein [Acidobacteriota bacterium]
MKVQVLGPGCAKCNALAENAKKAVAMAGVDAEVVKVTEAAEIESFGVLLTPGLAIDGVVKSAGKVVAPEQIARWLKEDG